MRLATIAIAVVCGLFVLPADAQKPKPKTKIERQKENDEAFFGLTYAQQRWLVYSALRAKQSGVGWMGQPEWSGWKVFAVESESVVIMHRPFLRQDDWYGWVSGVDTSRLITDGTLTTGKEVFWIPRTKKWGMLTMHEYELIPDAARIAKEITPPNGLRLADFPPK